MKGIISYVGPTGLRFHRWCFSIHRTRAGYAADPFQEYRKYDGIVLFGLVLGVYR